MGTYNKMVDLLHDQLAQAEKHLVCADMIDEAARRDAEMSYWRGRVAALKAEIARAEEANSDDFPDPFNPHGSGPMPIEPREG